MSTRAVTLQDVAAAAGVHVGTVSRALGAGTRGRVSDDTAARIAAVAESLGYRANPIARGLRTNRSMTVGVLIPDLQNPFYPPIVRGVDHELATQGFVSLIAETENNARQERLLFDRLRARQVDGLVIATATERHDLIRAAAEDGVKIVLLGRTVGNVSLSAVVLDDQAGMRLAVNHLAELGHRKIGHVAGPQDISTGTVRRTAFLAACRAQGISDCPVVVGRAFTVEEGKNACEKLLANNQPTAIVAANDLMALGCLAAMKESGLRCPDDVSLVGINNMPLLDWIAPPLTSISTPQYQMGRGAAQMLLQQIMHGSDVPIEIRQLRPELVVRQSTQPPKSSRNRTRRSS